MAKKVEKKEKGFCGVKGLTEDMLIAAAEDLNASIGLDPAIDVEDLEGEELLEAVKTGMSEVYTADQLEDDTWKVMELLGIEAQEAPEEEEPEPEEKPKAKAGKKASKKTEPEPEDDDNGDDDGDDDGGEEEAPKSKKGKAAPAPAKGKKAAPKEEPEDDGDGDDDEPKAKKGAKAKAEPAKKAAPKKANDGPKYSRSDAFGETLMAGKKNKKSLAQIIEDSDALYSENTGRRSNPKESAWCANLSLKALAACGYVKVDGDSVEILVRP